MSKAELLEFTDELFKRGLFVDIVIAPGTVDPNSLWSSRKHDIIFK